MRALIGHLEYAYVTESDDDGHDVVDGSKCVWRTVNGRNLFIPDDGGKPIGMGGHAGDHKPSKKSTVKQAVGSAIEKIGKKMSDVFSSGNVRAAGVAAGIIVAAALSIGPGREFGAHIASQIGAGPGSWVIVHAMLKMRLLMSTGVISEAGALKQAMAGTGAGVAGVAVAAAGMAADSIGKKISDGVRKIGSKLRSESEDADDYESKIHAAMSDKLSASEVKLFKALLTKDGKLDKKKYNHVLSSA